MRSRVRWSACYTVVGTATSAATPKRSSCSQVARSDIRVEMNPVELPRLTTPARSEFPKRNSIGPSDRSAYLRSALAVTASIGHSVRVAQRGWRTVLCILLINAAACSGGHHDARIGAIVGRMHKSGGTPLFNGTSPPADVPLVGEIFVSRRGTTDVVTRTTTDSSGRFRMRVAPGSYDVLGSSPKSTQSPRKEPVILRPGDTVTVDLTVAI